jgi:hypothetical protein
VINDCGEFPLGFEIWLVEIRENVMAKISLKLSIEVLLLVHRVDEGVEADSIFAVLVQDVAREGVASGLQEGRWDLDLVRSEYGGG